MPDIVRAEIVDPQTLSEPEREALIDRLWAIKEEIFDGSNREEFAQLVVRNRSDETQIQLSYGPGDELAGFMAVHAYRRRFRDTPCTVLRAQAGLRRAYRGGGSASSFFVQRLIRTRLSSQGAVVYLGVLIHPSSYTAFARDAAAIWPSPGEPIPDDVMDFMLALAQEFGLEQTDPDRPLVRHGGWITRDTPAERRYWMESDHPAARFFIEQNPRFVHGDGLLTLVSFDMSSVGRTLWSWGVGRLGKGLRHTMGALERTVLKPNVDESSAEGLIQHLESFSGRRLDALRALRDVGTRYPVPARTVLFRAGEAGDAMFFVLRGAVQVLMPGPDGEEEVIDQLGANMMLGEMALVTGRPRSATARAATDCVLVRLTRQDLATLFRVEPALEVELWRVILRRVFDERARGIPGWAELTPMARKAAATLAAQHRLAEGERIVVERDSVLVLGEGSVQCVGPSGWSSLSPPAATTLAAGTEVLATAAARLALLDAAPPTGLLGTAS